MKINPVIVGLLAAGVGAWLLFKDKGTATTSNVAALTPEQQKQKILEVVSTSDSPETVQRISGILDQMSASEVQTVYVYLFEYLAKGTQPEPGPFADQVRAVSDKYQIFT